MAVLLGLDPGERRTGIALSDPAEILASPLCTHDRRRDGSLLDLVARLCDEHGVSTVVVGYPITQDASAGESAHRSEVLARKLRAHLRSRRVEVLLIDERYSTAEAERLLAGRSHSKLQRDALAAALVLQSHLDARRRPEDGSR